MGISKYYYPIDIYRQTIAEDDFGNMSEDGGVWEKNQTIQGMIQPKSGNRVEKNNDNLIISDYLMYVELDTDVLSTDRIYFGEKFYSIVNMKAGTGVSFKQHHQEWDLKRINNNEVL